jgi:hypothetical protein
MATGPAAVGGLIGDGLGHADPDECDERNQRNKNSGHLDLSIQARSLLGK